MTRTQWLLAVRGQSPRSITAAGQLPAKCKGISGHGVRLHLRSLTSIGYLVYAFLVCAVDATVKVVIGLDPMADDFAATMGTLRGHGLNCTLEAIKNMRFARCSNLECLVVFIASGFTASHLDSSFLVSSFRIMH